MAVALRILAMGEEALRTNILSRRLHGGATLKQKQDLAVIAHLCGAGSAATFARSGFQLRRDERCGDHDVATYVARVNTMKRQFRGLAK
jgi:hypothetical protein